MRSPRYCMPPTITVDHGTEFHFRSMMFPPFADGRGDKERNRSSKRPIVEHLHPGARVRGCGSAAARIGSPVYLV